MRTRASIKSHPIHPALVVYPIACLHGALACDLAGRVTGKGRWYRYGEWLGRAGIASGLVAAIPGLVDYLYTIPPRSSGKRRATKHALVNAAALTLFGISQWLRRREGGAPGMAVLGAEAAGVGLLMSGAWMGSTLIHRNFVGPDHRQADAGKYREERAPYWPGESMAVARVGELEVDQMKLLRVNGRRVVLGRTEDGYVAFDDHCSHRGASLADGVMICGTVQCLWHGSQFDAATGEVRAGPATEPIRTYQVDVVEDEVRLTIGPEGEMATRAEALPGAQRPPAALATQPSQGTERTAPDRATPTAGRRRRPPESGEQRGGTAPGI